MISTALIGFGFAGRTFHAPLLSSVDGISLSAILQRHGDEAEKAYPSARTVRTLEELLGLNDIQLVVVATSNPSHFSIAAACLGAGKNVVLDKPFTTTADEARQLITLAADRNLLLSVFHNRRWDGDFLTVKQLLHQGRIGRLTRFESYFDRFRPNVDKNAWRQRDEPGSGVLFDLGSHLLDQALVLFGDPLSVTASIRRERDNAIVDDTFDIALDYPTGLRVVCGASVLACAKRPRFALHGTAGSWMKLGLDTQEAALKSGLRPTDPRWRQQIAEPDASFSSCDGDREARTPVPILPGDYIAYYENVRDALLDKTSLAVTATQALRVMELLELCRQSSEEQKSLPATLSPL
jgi:scyllo-inositol 2-dehydrogenase (NADP+)